MHAQPLSAAPHLRALRALPFATVCTVVSAAGHELASGMPVPVRTVLIGWAAVWALATVLAGRERGLIAIAVALAVGQLGLHELFHLSGAAMASPDGAMSSAAGHLLCGPPPHGITAAQVIRTAGLDPRAYTHLAHHTWDGLTPGMLAGHGVAALVGGWWLRSGEAALWRLLRTRVIAPLRLLLAVLLGVRPAARPMPRPAAADAPGPRRVLLRHTVVRRGPPAYALAA